MASNPGDGENTTKRIVGKPWPPGVSPNPGGRPKILQDLERKLRQRESPYIPLVIAKLREMALGGGEDAVRAARVYLDRILGPPRTPMQPVASVPINVDLGPQAAMDRMMPFVVSQAEALAKRADVSGLTTDESLQLSSYLRLIAAAADSERRALGDNLRRIAGMNEMQRATALALVEGDRQS